MSNIVIVEDHHDFREFLVALISGTPNFTCVASYRSMEECLDKIGSNVPDLVLTDIGLPNMDGIEGIRRLKDRYPNLIVLTLTVFEDDDRIFDALCAGASGYLLKRTPAAKLVEALTDAVQGGAPISPEVARRVIVLFREIRPPQRADYDLTPHETRILKMLVDGHTYKTAAAALSVTPSAINFHLQKIYEKLHVHSKSEAVAKAIRNRLV